MAKRLSKADIYAKYDITYKAGKIVTPIGTMCELLKDGNSKTGKAVKTWSMNHRIINNQIDKPCGTLEIWKAVAREHNRNAPDWMQVPTYD